MYLRATRGIKVICLTERIDLELLDRFDRRRYHSRCHRTGLSSGYTSKVLDVSDCVAGHVIRIVPTINGKRILIHITAGNVSSRCNAWL